MQACAHVSTQGLHSTMLCMQYATKVALMSTATWVHMVMSCHHCCSSMTGTVLGCSSSFHGSSARGPREANARGFNERRSQWMEPALGSARAMREQVSSQTRQAGAPTWRKRHCWSVWRLVPGPCGGCTPSNVCITFQFTIIAFRSCLFAPSVHSLSKLWAIIVCATCACEPATLMFWRGTNNITATPTASHGEPLLLCARVRVWVRVSVTRRTMLHVSFRVHAATVAMTWVGLVANPTTECKI